MFRGSLLVISLCTICAMAISAALNHYTTLRSNLWLPGLIYLVVLTFAFNCYYWLKRGSDSYTGMLITGVVSRFLLSLIFLLVMWFLFRDRFLFLAVHFLLHYALFTLGEVRYLSSLAGAHRKYSKIES